MTCNKKWEKANYLKPITLFCCDVVLPEVVEVASAPRAVSAPSVLNKTNYYHLFAVKDNIIHKTPATLIVCFSENLTWNWILVAQKAAQKFDEETLGASFLLHKETF